MELDSKISWTIAVACACMNFLIMIPMKVSGVFFVEILDRYDVSRSQALYPSFTLSFVRCSVGPIVGYLAERFGLDNIMILGSVLSSVGISACFFAEDIATVTAFIGVIHEPPIGRRLEQQSSMEEPDTGQKSLPEHMTKEKWIQELDKVESETNDFFSLRNNYMINEKTRNVFKKKLTNMLRSRKHILHQLGVDGTNTKALEAGISEVL